MYDIVKRESGPEEAKTRSFRSSGALPLKTERNDFIMSDYLFKGLAHIGIRAGDPQKCADFYCRRLGFRPYHQAEMGPVRLVFVENGGMVVEFVGIGDKPEGGAVDHIAIEVQGIEALAEELKAAGVRMDGPVASAPSLFPNGFKNVFFTGPAGERIELVDFSK